MHSTVIILSAYYHSCYFTSSNPSSAQFILAPLPDINIQALCCYYKQFSDWRLVTSTSLPLPLLHTSSPAPTHESSSPTLLEISL